MNSEERVFRSWGEIEGGQENQTFESCLENTWKSEKSSCKMYLQNTVFSEHIFVSSLKKICRLVNKVSVERISK